VWREAAPEWLEDRQLLALMITPAVQSAGFSLSTFAFNFPAGLNGVLPAGV
jgi:hypothetical protein